MVWGTEGINKIKTAGAAVSIDAVSKMMKEMGLVCKQSRMKKYNTTNKCSKYRKNRLKRNLNPNLPNTFWVSDITYMLTSDGDCYICVIMDLFSRKIIAYSVSEGNDTDLVLTAFNKAFLERGKPENLIFHSDQGTQYTSYKCRYALRQSNVLQSFSKLGTPYDNAVMERFIGIMKHESLSHCITKI